MAPYRPFAPPPPSSSFPPPPPPPPQNPNSNPNPNTIPHPPLPYHQQQQQQQPQPYPLLHSGYGRNSNPNPNFSNPQSQRSYHHQQLPPPPIHRSHQHQQQYPYSGPPPPAPPPPSSYAPPPPPPPPQNPQPPIYYSSLAAAAGPSSSQYSSSSLPPLPPPPAMPPPPPSSPPPPQPPSDPPPPQPPANDRKDVALPPKQALPKLQQPQQKRAETAEERMARKKREYDKQRVEERRQHMLKQSQASVLQRTKEAMESRGPSHEHHHLHGSISGSKMTEKRANLFLGGDRVENRLKKPTTFLCKFKFRNQLPDPSAQPKLLPVLKDKDCYTRYRITSLEKNYKPKLFVEPDLGIPLDLLDLSVYKAPEVPPPLDPEDEELLCDTEVATPIKHEGIRIKERPTDKGVSWLVKTQYISPLSMESAKLSLTEKQAKDMREAREGRNIPLENLNNREKQIQAIEESFKAAKLPPVHQTNPLLKPVEVIPLLPDLDQYSY